MYKFHIFQKHDILHVFFSHFRTWTGHVVRNWNRSSRGSRKSKYLTTSMKITYNIINIPSISLRYIAWFFTESIDHKKPSREHKCNTRVHIHQYTNTNLVLFSTTLPRFSNFNNYRWIFRAEKKVQQGYKNHLQHYFIQSLVNIVPTTKITLKSKNDSSSRLFSFPSKPNPTLSFSVAKRHNPGRLLFLH